MRAMDIPDDDVFPFAPDEEGGNPHICMSGVHFIATSLETG
jgi:hypothetical protein